MDIFAQSARAAANQSYWLMLGCFTSMIFTNMAKERYEELLQMQKERGNQIRQRKAEIPKRSQIGAQAVNIGFILERIAPTMHTFAFDRNDCRSLFDPIDYVIFEGLSCRAKVDRIIFADVKSGNARLSSKQRQIKDVVEGKHVEFDTYDSGRRE